MNNKVEKKKFLGMEVRVVNGEYLVLKDMFSALGRVRGDGSWTDEKKKVVEFANMGIINLPETLGVVVKKGQIEDILCSRLSDAPLLLTQFKPTSRAGEVALKTWIEFMKFVNDILTSLEVHKYIVTDKQKQLDHHELIVELGGKPVVENKMVNTIMAELIGIDGSIKKDELRIYQDQTTVDLLEVRDYVMSKFEQAYEIEESHSKAKEIAKRLAFKKYPMIKSA